VLVFWPAANAGLNGGQLSLSFAADGRLNDELLYESHLADSVWAEVGDLPVCHGAVESIDVPAGDLNCLYRMQIFGVVQIGDGGGDGASERIQYAG
jgi:hypothetical protein